MPPVDYDTPSRCNGGSLKPEFYPAWAKYLVKYIQAYLAEGLPVTMLSVQNETVAATSWDSCVWTSLEQKTFLRDHLYPAMKKAGLTDQVKVFIWDHIKNVSWNTQETSLTSDRRDDRRHRISLVFGRSL